GALGTIQALIVGAVTLRTNHGHDGLLPVAGGCRRPPRSLWSSMPLPSKREARAKPPHEVVPNIGQFFALRRKLPGVDSGVMVANCRRRGHNAGQSKA